MKDYKTFWKFLWPFLKAGKGGIAFYITVLFLNRILEMATSLLLGEMIDAILFEGTVRVIILCASVFLALSVLSFVSSYFVAVRGKRTREAAACRCKGQILRHIGRTSLKYAGTAGTMDFMQKLNVDTSSLADFLINSAGEILTNAIVFVLAIFMIFRIDVVCGIATLAELPLIIFLNRAFKDKILQRSKEEAEKMGNLRKGLYECMFDLGHVKRNEIGSLMRGRLHTASVDSIAARVRLLKAEFLYYIVSSNIDNFLQVFLFFYGGIAVIQGRMSAGEFMILYSYFRFVTSSYKSLLEASKNVQANKAYYERLKAIMDVPEESSGKKLPETIEEICLSGIRFGYTDAVPVLKDFSYTFKRGKIYAIAGSNGCGKSTMTSLLLGLYMDDHAGEITYNGCRIQELDIRRMCREKIGVCEQEPYLVEDTIRYNMIYSNDRSEDAKLLELAGKVSLEEFLKEAEKGLDTPVGEGGNALSGGQKQKAALVKAFYKDPPLLVLDEPTSAMDMEGQEKFLAYLKEIRKDKIIIIVTHDPHMLEEADEVVRMGAA